MGYCRNHPPGCLTISATSPWVWSLEEPGLDWDVRLGLLSCRWEQEDVSSLTISVQGSALSWQLAHHLFLSSSDIQVLVPLILICFHSVMSHLTTQPSLDNKTGRLGRGQGAGECWELRREQKKSREEALSSLNHSILLPRAGVCSAFFFLAIFT